MSLNFTQLAAFKAVAEAGSVGGGADALMVSQPAVSKQVKLLEGSLGVTLFERHARGARPTDAGELLFDYARRIFALADEAEQAMDDLQGLRRGKLAIGASPTVGVYFLPQILVRFRRKFPAIALTLEIENAVVLQRRLADGALDFGLSEVPPVLDELQSDVFMHDRLIAVAWPKHPLARRRGLTLRRLCDEPFVVRETGSSTKSLVERALANRGLRVNAALSVSSTEAVKRAVSAGMGVAIISSLAAGPDLAGRKLVRLPVKDLSITRPLHHLTVKGRRPSKAATAFLCLVRHAAAGRLAVARKSRAAGS
jgi:DNA-binding transcriptional LysR family regulator